MIKNAIRIEDQGLKIEEASARSTIHDPRSSAGFSLISAIFLLVVIAALGTFAVTLSTTQHQSAAMDVMGKRAYQAARAGIEWGAFQVIQSGVAAPPSGAGGFAALCRTSATSSSVPLAGTLAAFSPVSVSCSTTSAVEAVPVWIYTLSASAVTGGAPGNPGYIERQLSVTIAQ